MGGGAQTLAAMARCVPQPRPASAGDLLCVPPEVIFKPQLSPQSLSPLKAKGVGIAGQDLWAFGFEKEKERNISKP